MNIVQLSWRSIRYRPWSMTLTLVLFALGIGLVSFLMLVENQVQEKFEKNLAGVDLVIGAKGSPLQLILSSMYHIDAPTGNIKLSEIKPFLDARHPLIESAMPLSMGDSYRGYRIVGTDQGLLEWYDAKLANGDVWKYNFEVTVGHDVAEKLGLRIGSSFKSSHGLTDDDDMAHDDAESFVVVSILERTGSVLDQLILTTPQSFWLVHDHDHDHDHQDDEEIGNHLDHDHDGDGVQDHEPHDHESHDHDHDGDGVQDHAHHDHSDHDHNHDDHDHAHDQLDARDEENRDTPLKLLEEDGEKEVTSLLLRFKGHNFQALNMQRSINENTDMQAATPAIEINRLFSMMDSGERLLRLLAMVIVLVSGLSIFISLYNSLSDRKYELALMRSMGASPKRVFGQIVLEGLILAIMGCVLGLMISHLGLVYVGSLMEDSYRYQFDSMKFLPKEWWLFVFSIVIGILAALLPALQASKTDIADTLVNS